MQRLYERERNVARTSREDREEVALVKDAKGYACPHTRCSERNAAPVATDPTECERLHEGPLLVPVLADAEDHDRGEQFWREKAIDERILFEQA